MVAAFSFWAVMFLFKRSSTALLFLNAKKAALICSAIPAIIYAVPWKDGEYYEARDLAGLPVPTQRSLVMVLAFIASLSIERKRVQVVFSPA